MRKRMNRSICSLIRTDSYGPKEPFLEGGVHWRHLANTAEQSVSCGDAALTALCRTRAYGPTALDPLPCISFALVGPWLWAVSEGLSGYCPGQYPSMYPPLSCRGRQLISAHRSTQFCIPPGSLNRVPASAGVRAGMSPLPGGR